MQAVLDACASGRLHATPAVLICNNRDAEALERAALARHDAALVVLAGYMKKLGPRTLARYRNRVLNIHPAPLPRFGGQGMYGARVHEAVLASGERETGVTIHVVDAEYDHGPIVAQCRVPVRASDTPTTLAKRVLAREHTFLVETLERIVTGTLKLPSV